ncbi:MAG: hypothetical protein R3E32_16460 [Chitinophagales bacterium]
MISKLLKWCLKLIPVLLLLGIIYLNYSLYYHPTFKATDRGVYNEDVYQQLNFLKFALRNGAGDEMQSLFPEGFVFINSLYGLSWCNLIRYLDRDSPIYKEGIDEISWSIKEVNSPKAKQIFPENLPLAYGVFYKGWSNVLLGSKLAVQSEEDRDSSDIRLFKQYCSQISTVLSQSNSPYLESYHGQAWPADMMVAMASINIHDQIFEEEYQSTIEEWVIKVRQKLDVETGLIPHSVEAISGNTFEGARGSSQSLMLNFLKDIDGGFAQEQFKRYKELFLDSRFFLLGIREYAKGQRGRGSIDSGPVILGIGGAASIVGQRTMGKYESWDTYEGLRNCIEGFGVAYTFNAKKRYVFGQLPMADAFIAWSNSLENKGNEVKVDSNWRLKFQILSVLLVVMFAYLIRE